jgi:histidyl-tRNA synthetase
MSKGPQRIRGTQDIWGEASDRFQKVVETFDRVRRLYGFGRIEIPVFEATEVFARSIGETSDIVSKEMYTFPDKGGDSVTLRPEFTAGICRAYLSEGWQQHAPMKVATHGPVFRYERPQKGRFRQFHQLDAEIIGTDSPLADVELLTMADQLLHELGIATASRSSSTRSAMPRRAMPGARPWSPTSRRIAATCPKTAWSASRRTRFASSTARTRATGPRPTARPASMIS